MEIVPLTEERLKEMYSLLKKVFPYEKDENIIIPLKGSLNLDDKESWKWLKDKDCATVNYFTAIEGGKIIGVTGIYTNESDKNEASWVAWFSVDPEFRGRGIGKQLLEFVIDIARKQGKKFMRLYTSDHPNEAIANRMYDKIGFRLFREEYEKDLPGIKVLYKELKL